MSDKKVSVPQLERWLKSSVTKLYLSAIKQLNDELCTRMASGQCIAPPGSIVSTSELYHQSHGASNALNQCYFASDLMYDLGFVDEPEDEEETEDE